MSEKKKSSGAFYKKRKAQLERENTKLARTFQEFFSDSRSGSSRENVNLQSAFDMIEDVTTYLESMRSENGMNSVITDPKVLAEKLEINPEFSTEIPIRPRKIKKQFSYGSDDQPVTP